ncbi:MAG: hypothetical protein L0Y45_10515 [Woeseiaceae bacterium]|nr:hypothetical protein [Woeseiaceae bacterium]
MFSDTERQRGEAALMTAITATIKDPSSAKAHFERLKQQLTEQGNLLSPENRQDVLAQMDTRFGISQGDAEQAYDRLVAKADESMKAAQDNLLAVRQQSLEAADVAAEAVSKAAFGAFIASLLGLVAAATGAIVGRAPAVPARVVLG